jgi:tripartite-type tricarboxylate transporter receptor subunit TctC
MIRTTFRFASTATIVAFALLVAGATQAQAPYPEKPIHILVGVNTAELVARLVAPAMSEALGKQIVIDFIPGAAGNIATDRVAKSAPDGYTLLMSGDAAMTTNVTLYDKLAYDPLRDFAPVALLAESMNVLVVPASSTAKSVRDLVAMAKAEPGRFSYGSGGSGTSQHLAGALFTSMSGINMVHVPYKNVSQLLPDLIAGRVTSLFGNVGTTLPFVRDGKLRAIAVTSLKRASALPDLPTMAESGYPGFEAVAWFGIVAPAGTPAAIVARLHKEAARVIGLPEIRSRVVDMGLTPTINTPEEFAARIKAEIPKKGKIVRDSGAKAD